MRPALALFVTAALTAALMVFVGDPGGPVGFLVLGAFGSGAIALAMVLLRDPVKDDLLKAALATAAGVALLSQQLPGWMVWPFFVGPWAGLVFSAVGREPHRVDEDLRV